MTKQTKTIDHSINGVKPINQAELATYNAVNGDNSDSTHKEHLWKPGVSANPKGRPKGSKNKLSTQFVDDLAHEWNDRGAQALQDLNSKDLVQACIAILPKDVMLSLNQDDVAKWVINAQPNLSTVEWQRQHGLIEHDSKPTESDT